MNKSITIKMSEFESEYILEEFDDGSIKVKVPYLDKDDEDVDVVKHNVVEVEKGDKAEVIKQYFYEEAPSITRAGVAYNIDEVIFDETELPPFIEPDIIT